MSTFFSKYKFLIIGVVVIFAIFIGYGMLKSSPEGEGTITKTVVGADTGPSGSDSLAGGSNLDDEFVIQLLAIQSINFNTEFFDDPVYKGLIDQFRPLGDRPVGRPNPFYPIGQDNGFVGVSTAELSDPVGTFTITSTSSATSTARRATTTPAQPPARR